VSSRISSKMEWQTAGDATRETELVALWGEPFDHLTRQAVDDFGSFPRLGGCAYSPLRVAKLAVHGRFTWVLTDLKPAVLERAGAAQIYGPLLPPRRDLQYPCRLLPWLAEVRAGAPFSRPRLAVGC